MWKSRDDKPAPLPVASKPTIPPPAMPANQFQPIMETPRAMDTTRTDIAHIGKSVLVKGELSGSEDLYLDGEVEGSIDLREHSLVIGPHGRVRANIFARDVVVHGKVDGNVSGTERIVIEDGAFFKGAIDIKKEAAKPEASKAMAAAASYSAPAPAHVSTSAAAAPAQGSLAEPKKY
jgi:cytoskeletal protein CcmA (bactofilin family)